jgi:hypothetical protein
MKNDVTIYNQYAPVMDTGDSLLYVGNAFISHVIQWWVKIFLLLKKEKDKPKMNWRPWPLKTACFPIYNHGNMVLRLAAYEGKTDRRWVLDARASGVFPVLLSRYLEEYNGHCYWYPLKDQYGPQRVAIGCTALELAGRKYDFMGLVKNALGRVSANARKVFCTESIFLSYRDGGKIVVGDKTPRPDQLPALGVFKEPIKLF